VCVGICSAQLDYRSSPTSLAVDAAGRRCLSPACLPADVSWWLEIILRNNWRGKEVGRDGEGGRREGGEGEMEGEEEGGRQMRKGGEEGERERWEEERGWEEGWQADGGKRGAADIPGHCSRAVSVVSVSGSD
jgi:hypothetical protein